VRRLIDGLAKQQFVRDVLAAYAALVGADHLFRFQQLRAGRSTG